MTSLLKGKAIVGQSGGCTAVINKSLLGVIESAKNSKAITHILGSQNGIEGILNESFIDLGAQPKNLLKMICGLPSAALGSSRYSLRVNEELRVIEIFKKHNIRYVFLIGGNDTANTSLRISNAAEDKNYDLRIIHIPKTIDNDLMETDHTPGYGSVARFAAITTQEAALDTKAMRKFDPVKIIELMGRNSGWIVAAASLLKNEKKDAPHILQIPEVPFNSDFFIKQVDQVLCKVGYCIVVISETIRDIHGNRIGSKKEGILSDPFGHKYVEGASNHLAKLIEKNLKIRARFDKPGTIQRMSMAYTSSVDQKEAYMAGSYAVKWALQGLSKVMVSFKRKTSKKYGIVYVPADLKKIPNREKYIPSQFFNKKTNTVTSAFLEYALPLLSGNLPKFQTF